MYSQLLETVLRHATARKPMYSSTGHSTRRTQKITARRSARCSYGFPGTSKKFRTLDHIAFVDDHSQELREEMLAAGIPLEASWVQPMWATPPVCGLVVHNVGPVAANVGQRRFSVAQSVG